MDLNNLPPAARAGYSLVCEALADLHVALTHSDRPTARAAVLSWLCTTHAPAPLPPGIMMAMMASTGIPLTEIAWGCKVKAILAETAGPAAAIEDGCECLACQFGRTVHRPPLDKPAPAPLPRLSPADLPDGIPPDLN